jgi:hypothetical protein
MDALTNHRDKHLSRQLLKANDIRETLDATVLIDELNELVSKTKSILQAAESEGKRGTSLQAIKELRSSYEFMVKLAVTLHDMKAKAAEEESSKGSQTVKAALESLDITGLKLYRCLLRYMSGVDITEELAQISASVSGQCYRKPEPRPVIDVEPMPEPVWEPEPVAPACEPVRRTRTAPAPARQHTPLRRNPYKHGTNEPFNPHDPEHLKRAKKERAAGHVQRIPS